MSTAPTHRWRRLTPGVFDRRADRPGADPMWVWADASGYADLGLSGPPDSAALWCVLERGDVIATERHTVATAAQAQAALQAAELAMPVVPQRMPPAKRATKMPPPSRAVKRSSRSRVLVGVIDSGCPFAAAMLRDRAGLGTRVLGLWDQDDEPAFADGGFLPPGFGYGRVIDRSGLNAFMASARGPGGGIDESACYRLAGYGLMARAASHGAAVLSQLFGRPLHGGSLQPRPGAAPSWDRDGLAIDRADLVFVDLPRAAVQDASSAALARYLVDGLRFILAHAVKGQHVVVNISNGSSRTGHEGLSLIERALAGAVTAADGEGIRLDIVLPVGNTNMEQRHAVLSHPDRELTLFLPPGCESPQFVTVRWPPQRKDVHLRVTPPFGRTQVIRRGQALGWCGPQGASCGVVSPPPAAAHQAARSLLAFAPTSSPDPARALAPAGRWRIALHFDDGAPELPEPVQFWVSRNQRNPGAQPRGRQADYVDVDRSHHPQAWLRYSEDDPPDVTIRDGIRRAGALTGLATAALTDARIRVVGSAYVAGRREAPSRYSASPAPAGTAGGSLPLTSAPGDASRALPGLSLRGNRSGEIVRMAGTSFAAPLLARALANGQMPREKPRHPPSARLGKGLLEP